MPTALAIIPLRTQPAGHGSLPLRGHPSAASLRAVVRMRSRQGGARAAWVDHLERTSAPMAQQGGRPGAGAEQGEAAAARRGVLGRAVELGVAALVCWSSLDALAVGALAIGPGGVGLLALVAGAILVLRGWQRQLVAAAGVEQRAVSSIMEASQDRDARLGAISCQLRAPLASIFGYAQTMRDHHHVLNRGDVERFSERLAVNTAQFERLVDDLLDLHRGEGAPPRAGTTEPPAPDPT